MDRLSLRAGPVMGIGNRPSAPRRASLAGCGEGARGKLNCRA
jgi:hypothetical protein